MRRVYFHCVVVEFMSTCLLSSHVILFISFVITNTDVLLVHIISRFIRMK